MLLTDRTSVLACAVLAACTFANTLSGTFVLDDHAAVGENGDARGVTPVASLWRHDFWGTELSSSQSHKSWRPLTVLSFRLNHDWGGVDPVGFHGVNVALHAAASVLVYAAARLLARCPRMPALAAGLIFAAHPVHSEAVANIVGRAELLCACFYLAGLLAYARSVESFSSASSSGLSVRPWLWLALSAMLYAGACLSKEQGFTMIGVAAAMDVLVLSTAASSSRRGVALVGRAASRGAVLVAVAAWLLQARVRMSGGRLFPSVPWLDNPAAHAKDPDTRVLTFGYQHAYSLACLLVMPILPLLPFVTTVVLRAEYAYNHVPLVESLADPRNGLTALAVLGMLGLALGAGLEAWGSLSLRVRVPVVPACAPAAETRATQPRRNPRPRALVVGTLLLLVPYVPVSNLLGATGFVIAERTLYLPSIGLCILAGHAMSAAAESVPRMLRVMSSPEEKSGTRGGGGRRRGGGGGGVSAATCLLGVLGVVVGSCVRHTMMRNAEWQSDATLWAAEYRTAPSCFKARNNYAAFVLAGTRYVPSPVIQEQNSTAMTLGRHLAPAPVSRKTPVAKLREAAELYIDSMRLTVDAEDTIRDFRDVVSEIQNRKQLRLAKGLLTKALAVLQRKWASRPQDLAWSTVNTIRDIPAHHPNEHDILRQLGAVVAASGDVAGGATWFGKAVEADAKDVVAWYFRGRALEATGEREAAWRAYVSCSRHAPRKVENVPPAHVHYLALCLVGEGKSRARRGEFQKAAKAFRRALDVEPSNEDARADLRRVERQMAADGGGRE